MLVGSRLLLLLTIIWSSALLLNIKGDVINTKERRRRHIFPLFGYLQGYKIGQNLALQLHPFVLSPVIIVPSVNQQQSVNIQHSIADESFQENGDTFQAIMPVKLILDSSLKDVETNFRTSIENGTAETERLFGLNDTLRQIGEATNSSTDNEEIEIFTATENYVTTDTNEMTTLKYTSNTPTTINYYPTAIYNNEAINSLQLTTPSSAMNLGLPLINDNWQNFTLSVNKVDNKTENLVDGIQESASAGVGSYQYTTEIYYPRPNTRFHNPYPAWYNAMVDQFPITTNSYRDEEKEPPLPPRYDDRWHRFSSLSKVVLPASGFKPLAGLYYDGFLHKSLTKKTGFIPFDKYYFY